MILKFGISLLTAAMIAGVVACGDDGTGPSVPDLTPSVLSLAFTGDSSKIMMDFGSRTMPEEALAFSIMGTPGGSKGACEVTASWTICSESSFYSYTLFRSLTPGISSSPSSALVLGVFTDPNTNAFTDDNIEWSTTYYYALRTSDANDNSVWSNEDTLTTPYLPLAIPDSVVATVDVGDGPSSICPIPSGAYVYVTNFSDGTVSVIRTLDNTVIATVGVGTSPAHICALPSGDYVYVTNSEDGNVSVIRTSDNTVVATIDVGDAPSAICSLPSGDYVYVTNYGNGTVSVIRTADNTVIGTVDTGDYPAGICSLPSGQYVYVTNDYDDSVTVIYTPDNTVTGTVAAGDGPLAICALPSGQYVYVANYESSTVSVIRTSDNTVVATVDTGTNPVDICSLPSGEYVYVTSGTLNSVSVIRTSDNIRCGKWSIRYMPASLGAVCVCDKFR
jgi:YVTN family beta-propeller protein